MLIDFSFSNFKSFRDEQSFSMTRDKRFKEPEASDCSAVTAVYGANASGKSNFLEALRAMRDMVSNSYIYGDKASSIPRDPFLLGTDTAEQPSMFFAEFIAENRLKYQYFFRYDSRNILDEELTFFKDLGGRPSTHSSLLFSRDENGEVRFGAMFKGPKSQVRKTVALRPNALLLSAAAAAGIESVQPAFSFFKNDIACYESRAFEQEQPRLNEEFKNHTDFAEKIAALMKYADFGIAEVKSVPVAVPPEVVDQFTENMQQQFGADKAKVAEFFSISSGDQLQFTHASKTGSAEFGMGRESVGTLAAMSFFSLALRQLSRRTITLVDEIDTSLHPTFVEELVSLYTDPETNPHGSQLIFTTHDVSLITQTGMANRVLQPDQIWFVEKDKDGASELFPMTDIGGIRKDENVGRNYLKGVYGAVPSPSFHETFAQMMSGDDA